MSDEVRRWQLSALFGFSLLLLAAAVTWEWLASHDLTQFSRHGRFRIFHDTSTQCTKLDVAMGLNHYAATSRAVQWRRGLIAAFAVVACMQPLAGISMATSQALVMLMLVWVVYTNTAGFHDYHTNSVATNVIDESLRLAILDYTDAQQAAQCTPDMLKQLKNGCSHRV